MAGRTEGPPGVGGTLTDAPAAVIAGRPTRREVSQLVRQLGREFDTITGRVHQERGVNLQGQPLVVGFDGFTQAHVDGIASIFGTTASPHPTLGRSEQLITIPGSGDSLKFYSRARNREDGVFDTSLVVAYAHPVGESNKAFHQIDAADARGRRDTVIVLGPDSVSFVQDPHHGRRSTEDPKRYLIDTLTPYGFISDFGFDHVLLRHPLLNLNLAKAITHFDPDLVSGENPIP